MEPSKLPNMTHEEIENLLICGDICRIAFFDQEYPYIIPFQYAYVDGAIYFHFTNYGRKIKLLNQNPKVCVEIERLDDLLRSYQFISLKGQVNIVNDEKEREKAINKLRENGRQKLSPAFLSVHGINPRDGWNYFTSDKSFLIVKLSNILEIVGLKSPSHITYQT